MKNHILRRKFLSRFCVGTSALWTIPGAFAEALSLTPRQTEGPLYPDNLPLDTDNDLLVINETTTPAVGEVTHLSGRILDKSGTPVRNALVEIWQVDSRGVYIHSQTAKRGNRDKNFQGFGRFLTGSSGEYYFRTIKPVRYPGRTPHIHIGVSLNGKRIFTSQILIKGEALNAQDQLYRAIKDPKAKQTVMADFKPVKGCKLGSLAAEFNVVLGTTVEENQDPTIKGSIGKPVYRRR